MKQGKVATNKKTIWGNNLNLGAFGEIRRL